MSLSVNKWRFRRPMPLASPLLTVTDEKIVSRFQADDVVSVGRGSREADV